VPYRGPLILGLVRSQNSSSDALIISPFFTWRAVALLCPPVWLERAPQIALDNGPWRWPNDARGGEPNEIATARQGRPQH